MMRINILLVILAASSAGAVRTENGESMVSSMTGECENVKGLGHFPAMQQPQGNIGDMGDVLDEENDLDDDTVQISEANGDSFDTIGSVSVTVAANASMTLDYKSIHDYTQKVLEGDPEMEGWWDVEETGEAAAAREFGKILRGELMSLMDPKGMNNHLKVVTAIYTLLQGVYKVVELVLVGNLLTKWVENLGGWIIPSFIHLLRGTVPAVMYFIKKAAMGRVKAASPIMDDLVNVVLHLDDGINKLVQHSDSDLCPGKCTECAERWESFCSHIALTKFHAQDMLSAAGLACPCLGLDHGDKKRQLSERLRDLQGEVDEKLKDTDDAKCNQQGLIKYTKGWKKYFNAVISFFSKISSRTIDKLLKNNDFKSYWTSSSQIICDGQRRVKNNHDSFREACTTFFKEKGERHAAEVVNHFTKFGASEADSKPIAVAEVVQSVYTRDAALQVFTVLVQILTIATQCLLNPFGCIVARVANAVKMYFMYLTSIMAKKDYTLSADSSLVDIPKDLRCEFAKVTCMDLKEKQEPICERVDKLVFPKDDAIPDVERLKKEFFRGIHETCA